MCLGIPLLVSLTALSRVIGWGQNSFLSLLLRLQGFGQDVRKGLGPRRVEALGWQGLEFLRM